MAVLQFKVVIIGAGSAGISVASRLKKHIEPSQIAIIDPSEVHYYQPLWTLVGGGVARKEETVKKQSNVIPPGINWIRKAVSRFSPEKNTVELSSGESIAYDYLIVATGLQLQWEKIAGLKGSLGKNGICSIYGYEEAERTAQLLERFEGGTAIFTMPPVPIKCAGAPQKIMYLADEIFRRNGVRQKTKIHFATAGKAMFGVPIFSESLVKVVQRKNIEPLYQHRLIAVDAEAKTATFQVTHPQGEVTEEKKHFDLLHVVPPQGAHSFISESALANQDGDQKGWLAVDKHTLQSTKFPNVFGVGDVTGVPNSKTGAAIRKQAPVVVENLLAQMQGKTLAAKYDGYSSCPLVTGFGKVMLAEFGYDGKLMPTFPLDPTKERRSMWILKRHLLPILYWDGMLKGRA